MRGATMARYTILALFLALGGYPLVWMALAACRPEAAVLAKPFAMSGPWTLGNLRTVLETGAFARAYLNSILVCTAGVAGAVALAALAAFAFARLRFRCREAVFLLLLVGMMVPVHITLIPLNRLMGGGGLAVKDTLLALIGPYIGFALPISILILRGAFEAIPDDLFDAARIDGCSAWGQFLHVGLPLTRPALAAVVIFNFLTMWNEFAFALTLITSGRLRTLPLALWQFKGERGMIISQTCAALLVALLPLLIVYAIAQRHIIRGLTAGAVKQ